MRLLLFALLAAVAWAANARLYLKDGSYQLVREYQVQQDRVRFYSIERSEWEEIPLNLVDLKRTEEEAAAHKAELDKDAKAISEEETAEREAAREVSRIPQDPGVYWLDGNRTRVIKQGETTVHNNKGRSVLKRLSPIPVVSGKATLEMDGPHSANVFSNPEQEFYFQLAAPERFALLRLTTKGAVRIVENVTTIPVTKEIVEEPEIVPTLNRQIGDNLYKIWPKEPLPDGEYALVEYTAGQLNMQIWDFAVKRGKKQTP
jgi:hypothetical protein